jgi:glycosyltransferase involved in cell wall biosynthesis
MKIAILGIRGLPSSYSGYETFIGELAPRLAQRGHEVTIYCRSALFPERPPAHLGLNMRYLPSMEHKFLSTLSHTAFAITDASLRRFDLIFVVNAANGLFGFIPRLCGKKCVLNVDGMEWLRPKWNKLGKWFFKTSAQLGTKFYNEIVTDAEEMHRLYAREFGIDSVYIAYGANIETSKNPEVLKEYGVEPFGYYLIASRMIPDNNADLIVEAFVKSGSVKTLLIAGGADYKGNLIERAFLDKLKSLANDRVKFTGHVSKPGHIKELHCNCFAYVHGHQFGGINPSILKALGFGNLVLALNTPFNAEVLDNGKYGLLYAKNLDSLVDKIRFAESHPDQVRQFRALAPERIRERFTWEQITDQYEELFGKITHLKPGQPKA